MPASLDPSREPAAPQAAVPQPLPAGHEFSELFEQAAIGMAVLDPDGRCLRINQAACAMLGRASADLCGHRLQEFLPDDEADECERVRARLLDGPLNRAQAELRYRHRNGELLWGQFAWSLVRDAQRRPAYFVWQAQDITQRRLAAEALRESEERFRSLTFLTSDGYWEQDEQLRFTEVRIADRSQRFMYTDVVGLARWEIPDAAPLNGSMEEHRRRLEAHQPFRDFRYSRRHADGRVTYVSVSGEPVHDAHGRFRGYRGSARDITEEVLAERRLQEARSMVQMAAQIGRLGAWAWEAGAPRLRWSDEVCAIHEVPRGFSPTPQEAIGFIAPAYRAEVDRATQACARHGTAFEMEVPAVTARGREVWVRLICEPQWDERGRVMRIHGASQDITEAKRAADEARRLAGQLTATLESLTDAFCTIDREGRFTYLNAEAEKLLGRTRDRALGRRLFDLLPQLQGGIADLEFARALRENVTVDFEARYEPLDIRVQVKAYPSEQGLAVDVKDITERYRAREEILRLNAELEDRVRQRTAQLEAANKELQAFSYSIAHDVRAPLATIDGFSSRLEEMLQGRLDPRGQHYLQRIRRAVHHMGELTDGLLALSNLSRAQLRREPVDLAALARAAAEMCAQQSPDRQVDLVIEHGLPAEGDPRLLAQVVGNLVGNAWKFSARTPGARIEVGRRTQDGEDAFFVRDNGAGFDMAHAGKLFEAFQRLHGAAEFEGTGIGLAIVQKIVSRHGGRVWAQAQPGQGACFFFTLPPGSPDAAAH